MIIFLTRRPSEEYVGDYVKRIVESGGPPAQVLCFEDVLEREELPLGQYVFTGLNRFGPGLTEALTGLYEAIETQTGVPPLNHPTRCLGRFELLKALHAEGINDFTARGAWEDLSDLRYPVFVRDRSRDGGVPRRLYTPGEVEAEIGWALVRGADISELIVVEFLDTKDESGLFRKYSAYIVGETIIPVSLDRGRDWVLRFPVAEFNREGLDEELRFVLEGPHQDQLRAVGRVSQTGYGRMDYSLYRGRVQTWEINTLPTMRLPAGATPLAEDLKPYREEKKNQFKKRFQEAWWTLERALPEPRTIPLSLPRELVSVALEELSTRVPATFPQEERYSHLKALFRPVKPMVMPVATKTIIPLIARRTIRRRLVRDRSLGMVETE